MGIQKRVFIVAVCDICNDEFEDGNGGTQCFLDKKQATQLIKDCDWVIKNGKLKCPNCLEEV